MSSMLLTRRMSILPSTLLAALVFFTDSPALGQCVGTWSALNVNVYADSDTLWTALPTGGLVVCSTSSLDPVYHHGQSLGQFAILDTETKTWSTYAQPIEYFIVQMITASPCGEIVAVVTPGGSRQEFYGHFDGSWRAIPYSSDTPLLGALRVSNVSFHSNGDIFFTTMYTEQGHVVQALQVHRRGQSSTDRVGVLSDLLGESSRVNTVVGLSDDQYLIGGEFWQHAGSESPNIALYTASTGTIAGFHGGANGLVSKLAVAPNGYLYAFGSFTSVGEVNAQGAAKFDLTLGTWSPIDGIDRLTVQTIAPNGELLVSSVHPPFLARYNPLTQGMSRITNHPDWVASPSPYPYTSIHSVLALAHGEVWVDWCVLYLSGMNCSGPALFEPCRADVDCVDGRTIVDVFAFLDAWFVLASPADIDFSGTVTVQDLFEFLRVWFSGC